MEKDFHICYCVDKDYEKYALVSIISLLINSGINPEIHIIHNKFTDKKILGIAEKIFRKKFKYYLADDSKFYGLPVLGGYSVYYRLMIPSLLHKTISKILYLDCDTIIDGDLKKLFNISIEKKALGAVEDKLILKSNYKNLKKRLKMPCKCSYFNSGVLLLNLDFFREKNLSEKIIKFMKNNHENLAMHDQDGLNSVLYKDWKKLPAEYNFLLFFGKPIIMIKNPKIIHLSGLKPELLRIIDPFNKYCKKYYKYHAITGLPDKVLVGKELMRFFKKSAKYIFETKFFF